MAFLIEFKDQDSSRMELGIILKIIGKKLMLCLKIQEFYLLIKR
jgi:hypothetical protein